MELSKKHIEYLQKQHELKKEEERLSNSGFYLNPNEKFLGGGSNPGGRMIARP